MKKAEIRTRNKGGGRREKGEEERKEEERREGRRAKAGEKAVETTSWNYTGSNVDRSWCDMI